MRHSPQQVGLCVLLAAALVTPTSTLAATRVYTDAASDNDWFNPANWDPNGAPDDDDTLSVGGGATAATTQNVLTSSGGSITISDAGTDVSFSGLNIGFQGEGSLLVEAGAHLGGYFTTIGTLAGASGTVDINGAGTVWDADQLITVGGDGAGRLLIGNGAEVNNIAAVLADDPGSEANVFVNGSGTAWNLSQRLEVGAQGAASLSVTANVTSSLGMVGIPAGGTGDVFVSSGGSWDVGILTVGGEGDASINVASGGMLNSGSANVANGTVEVGGVTNAIWSNTSAVSLVIGRPTGADATLTITSGGLVDTADGVTIAATGEVALAGGTLEAAGSVSVEGELSGQGSVNSNLGVINRGLVRPATADQALSIGGGYQQLANGVLAVEIGDQFGQLGVGGGVTLGGELELTLVPGFTPAAANTFRIVDSSDPIVGTFSNVAPGARLTTFNGGSFQVNYGADSPLGAYSVVLSDYLPPIPGDYNNNGTVDAADYAAWLAALGGTELANDPTPGTVDQSDYDFWKAHFGETSGSGNSFGNPVPEPATLVLLSIATVALLMRRRSSGM